MIPLSAPNLKGNELKYLKECIKTEWVSSVGKYVDVFEERIAKYTGSKFAIACSSGTSALHLSLVLAGVKNNDEVIVPTMTFIATPNSVTYLNAFPIFMDCDDYYNIDIEKVLKFLDKKTFMKSGYSFNKKTNRRIVAIMPVHVSGNAVNIEKMEKICREKNIKIVEDAAEALGTKYVKGRYKGKHVGTIGLLGCLSFNGNKIITTGGGGMILTNDKKIANRAKYLSSQANNNPKKYIHNEIGYNYRLTNIQAALGVAQLEKINDFISKKKLVYDYYNNAFKKSNYIEISKVPIYARNNHWMVTLKIKSKNNSNIKNKLQKYLENEKIQTRPMWNLCHKQIPYKKYETYLIKKSYELHDQSLNIPCSTGIKKHELKRVEKKLKYFCEYNNSIRKYNKK